MQLQICNELLRKVILRMPNLIISDCYENVVRAEDPGQGQLGNDTMDTGAEGGSETSNEAE